MLKSVIALVVVEEEKIDVGVNNVSGKSETEKSQAGIAQSALAQLALWKSRVHHAGIVAYLEPGPPHHSHGRNIGILMACPILLHQILFSLAGMVCQLPDLAIGIDEAHATELMSLCQSRG